MQMMHLVVDGKATNLGLLLSEEEMRGYLWDLAETIEMRIMGNPQSVSVEDKGLENGVTVIAIIETSHIAIHTWPEQDDFNVNVDIFSCKEFDAHAALESLDRKMGLERYSCKILNRPLGGDNAIHS